MSYGGLGTIYNFPQTNDSTVIPNATFRVDVPTQAIVNEAVSNALPWVPTIVNSAASYLASSPQALAPAIPGVVGSVAAYVQQNPQTLTPFIPAVVGSMTSYLQQNPDAVQPLLDAAVPTIAATIERSSRTEYDIIDSLWPLLEEKLNAYVLRLAILGGAVAGVAWMLRKK